MKTTPQQRRRRAAARKRNKQLLLDDIERDRAATARYIADRVVQSVRAMVATQILIQVRDALLTEERRELTVERTELRARIATLEADLFNLRHPVTFKWLRWLWRKVRGESRWTKHELADEIESLR